MTRSSSQTSSECHVLNFFYDDDNGYAEQLKTNSKSAKYIEEEYSKLISAVRDETEEDEDPDKHQRRKELEAAELHNPENEATNPREDSLETAENETEDARQDQSDHDSAVDVNEEHDIKEIGLRDSGVVLGETYAPDSEKSLQNWMLTPFVEVFKDLAPADRAPQNKTVEEWYHGPAHFYNLEIDDNQLSCSKLEASDDLNKRLLDLVPSMPLPKYIKDLNIPLIQAKDIVVISEGADPEPHHPMRVKVDGEIRFLKMVDMSQYQPTKREIKLLKEVEKKGLHEKIRCPKILGLVYEKSKSHIMGFLQTDIEDPTPLTKMLDSDVIEENREKWAKESKRMVDVLHEDDIIWGDAKADNFMVDKHGDLWIIDFGGSYTDGWIDPELMETQEGDDMGTQKIINALEDPEANTYQPGEEDDAEESPKTDVKSGKKRSREEDESANDEEASTKRRR